MKFMRISWSIAERAVLVFFVLLSLAHADVGAQVASDISRRLEVVVLGSGGPGATGRAGSGYLILLDQVPRILVDAGPGTFARLGETGLSIAHTDIVLLTHLHIDHVGELPGIFKARAVSSQGNIRFRVYGPDGRRGNNDEATFPSTTRLLHLLFDKQGAFGYLRDFSAPISIAAHDLSASLKPGQKPQTILTEGELKISAIAGHHRDAPAMIYRIDYAARSVTFSGDIDAHGLANLGEIAQGTDLLVFNAVVLDPPQSPEILYSLHTPPQAIGQLAAKSKVGQLLFCHLSPAVENSQPDVIGAIRLAYPGSLRFATDGMVVVP